MATTFTRTAVAPFGAITVHRVVTALSGVATLVDSFQFSKIYEHYFVH